MDFHGPDFIIAIIAMSMGGWVITTWIRAKHGYPVEGECGGSVPKSDPQGDRKFELLSSEDARLNGKVDHLEARIAVLERIATNKPLRLAEEIDSLS